MTESRNLEAVSKLQLERRRVPRLVLSSVQLRLSENGKIFSVLNISSTGIAVRILEPNDLILFTAGREVVGTLNLEGDRHAVQFQINYVRKDRVGGEFKALDPAFESAIRQFTSPEMQARELRPMPSVNELLWFHSGRGCDIWVRLAGTAKSDLESLCMLNHERYIVWDSEQGLSTGRVSPSESENELRGVMALETLEFHPDSQVERGELDIAKVIILGSKLAEELKKPLLAALVGAGSGKRTSPGGRPGRA